MRPGEHMGGATPPLRPRSNRRLQFFFGSLALILFLAGSLIKGTALFFTDYMWFDSVNFTSVWSGILGTKILLGAVGALILFAAVWLNVWIADRSAPRTLVFEQEDDLIRTYKSFTHGRQGRLRTAAAALIALFGGVGFYAHWQEWLLFSNGGKFGVADPEFGRDVGFFVFQLPFLMTCLNALMVATVICLFVSLVVHYAQGALPFGRPHARMTSAVKAHISVLLGILTLLQAGKYFLNRYELSFSNRGVTSGANYTDVHFLLPALSLLAAISVLAALMFFVGARRKGLSLPVITVALWAVVSLIIGAIIPAGVQRFVVKPAESQKELPYIQRNIDATRAAMNLNKVQVHDFAYQDDLTAADLQDNAQTIRNVRLWDSKSLTPSYQRLQETRSFFKFDSVDVDRYNIDGAETQMMVSVREINTDALPAGRKSWVNEHLQYTHGYGAVASPANAVTSDGKPSFLLKDVPPTGTPTLTTPQVYFGNLRNPNDYSIVGTGQPEVDYVSKDNVDQTGTYKGSGGVQLSNPLKKLALAVRFGDINPLISNLVTSDAKAIYETNIKSRARKAAPFLQLDNDPYPVVLDGRIKWIQDAYTTSNEYPYAARANGDAKAVLDSDADLKRTDFSYVRNSVKIVTDAYDGNMTFYVVDDQDPVIKTWQKAFPKLFTEGSKMSPELREHLRYPEDLYRVQTQMFGQYHLTTANAYYSGTNRWNIAQSPSSTPTQATTASSVLINGQIVQRTEERIKPYYLEMRLPGDKETGFLMFQPFVPWSPGDQRKELSAFMTVRSNPDQYGQIDLYVMPTDRQIDGPAIVDANMQQNTDISRQLTLLNQQGSSVIFGDLLIIPINNSLLYVRPVFVQARQTQIPEFKYAIVAQGNNIAMQPTLQQALTQVFGEAPQTLEQQPTQTSPFAPISGTTSPGNGSTTTSIPANASDRVKDLLTQANAKFTDADTALRSGDLAGYQANVKAGADLVAQARQATP